MIYESIVQTIGNTPIIKLKTCNDEAEIYIKLEYFNPSGSVKDRAAFYMINKMLEDGTLKKGDTIVEPTSGNTGIGVAMVGASLGINVILTMPESMSIERRKILSGYGAKLELTDGSLGMYGAIERAKELSQKPSYVILSQFENKYNLQSHESTAKEIMQDFKELDVFVAGVGTGGTIMGVAKSLRQNGYKTKFIAVEPYSSSVLSGFKAGAHNIQGLGAGFVPKIYDSSIVDEVIRVSEDDSVKFARELIKLNGLFVGISSGAAYCAAKKVAKDMGVGKKILFMAPDSAERYLSTSLLGDSY